jgi:hypothetical protein
MKISAEVDSRVLSLALASLDTILTSIVNWDFMSSISSNIFPDSAGDKWPTSDILSAGLDSFAHLFRYDLYSASKNSSGPESGSLSHNDQAERATICGEYSTVARGPRTGSEPYSNIAQTWVTAELAHFWALSLYGYKTNTAALWDSKCPQIRASLGMLRFAQVCSGCSGLHSHKLRIA